MKFLVIIAVVVKIVLCDDTPYMREQLNAMQQYFDDLDGYQGPSSKFDIFYYEAIEECFSKFDDDILASSQNLAWKGFLDFFTSNGTETDRWNCNREAPWFENNP